MDINEYDELSVKQKVALGLALVLFNLLVFWLDLNTGDGISLQPLYVIPVVVAGVLLNITSLALLGVLSTVLRVEAYRLTAFSGSDFPYLPNLAATFASMVAVGAVVVIARHYRERYLAHQESAVGRRLGDIFRGKDR